MAIVWLVVLVACADDRATVERLAQVSRPFVEDFIRFERWAQRAQDGATALPGSAAVQEATFAPVRNNQDVLAATVGLREDHAMAFPDRARFPEVEWVAVRHRGGGTVRVAEQPQCDLNVPGWWRKGISRRCVLISRATSRGLVDTMTITMAFSLSEH